MRHFFLITILSISLAPLLATRWVGYPSPIAIVYVHPGEEQIATQISIIALQETARIAPLLGLIFIKPISIYAYSNRVEFVRAAGTNPLLIGISYRPSGMILIDVTGVEGPVRQVLAHELTHSLLNERLGIYIDNLPTWTNEGMAGFFSSPVTQNQLPKLSHLWHSNGVLSLKEMESAFDSGKKVDVAYQQSLSMLAWLQYNHPGAIEKLIKEMSGGRPFEEALNHSSGLSPDQWLEQWKKAIPNYELLIGLLSSPVVYAPLALIIIFLATLKMRKLRETTIAIATEGVEEAEAIPYRIASTLVELHTRGGDISQYPVWEDIHTP